MRLCSRAGLIAIQTMLKDGRNEEMVDWMAIQMPKIMDVYESVSNSWNYDDKGVKK